MSEKTLKVKPWGKDQGDFVVIDAGAYDESFHSLFEAAAVKEGSVADIKAKLDALGIEYKAGASKPQLEVLLEQAAAVAGAQAKLTEKGIQFEQGATLEDLQKLLAEAQ